MHKGKAKIQSLNDIPFDQWPCRLHQDQDVRLLALVSLWVWPCPCQTSCRGYR